MSAIKPFANDQEYEQAELGWLWARTSRLAAENELRESERDINSHGTRVGRRHRAVVADESRRLATNLRAKENKLRGDIDARLKATRKAGTILGIDKLCEQYALGEHERIALLIATVPTLGEKLTQEVLGKLDRYITTSPSIEMMMLITEAESVEDRLAVLAMFDGPDVPLVKHGLVTLDHRSREVSPAELPSAQFSLTESAFRTILGLDQ